MDKRVKSQRERQEDAVLNKVLCWIVGAVVLEFLLLLVNRFYVKYSVADLQSGAVEACAAALNVLSVAFPICFVLALIWWIMRRKKDGRLMLPAFLTIMAAALSVCCILSVFLKGSGIRFLLVAVPVVAVLALLYYLYQQEFFTVALICVLGLLGVWMSQHAAAHPAATYGYLVVLAAVLVAVVLLSRVMDGSGGVLRLAGKPRRVMPKGANYVMFYVTCAITAAVVIASIFLGAHLALYGVMVAWLLVSAVYYTVKLM